MKNEMIKELLYAKTMLLLVPCYKRQKYVDNLRGFVMGYVLDYDDDLIGEEFNQLEYLTHNEKEELFSNNFNVYKFLNFRKKRLEIDNYNPEDCRTFEQFNKILQISCLLMDYENSLVFE